MTVAERKMAEYLGVEELTFEALRAALVGERRPETVVVVDNLFSVTYASYNSNYGTDSERIVMVDRAYGTERTWTAAQ